MTATALRTLASTDIQHLTPLHQAMWHDAQGNWQSAHSLAQDVDTPDGAWVHAYLHRREGDNGNAAYWYRRAGKSVSTGDFSTEWADIVERLPAPSSR